MTDRTSQSSDLRLTTGDLRRACDTLEQRFHRSDELPAAKPYLGQTRAEDAIRFGVSLERPGYNVYVMGPSGSHRHGLVEELAAECAASRPTPSDWCYVNNFSEPEHPTALELPANRGAEFRDDMHTLIEEMLLAIPAAFEDDDYRNQMRAIEEETQKEVEALWQSLDALAARKDIGVLRTPTGYVLAPVTDGKVIDDEDFDRLPAADQKRIQKNIKKLNAELEARVEEMPKLRLKLREKVKSLNQDVTSHAVSVLLTELKHKYRAVPRVIEYLEAVETNIIENSQHFQKQEAPSLPFMAFDPSKLFAGYEVNLVVNNSDCEAAPVITESNPSYSNIIGKIEHRAEMGALFTDFRMVRSGALLQANGGYLVLDVHRLLSRPFVWEALKQALFAGYVRIESPGESYGLVSTTSLKPEPIPLNVKIILIGERWLYYMLSMYDSEFNELFKVAADFDDDVERSKANVGNYALLIAERARSLDLLPLDESAVRHVIEQRARRAGDGERLSMHMRSLDDLLIQSDHWAHKHNSEFIERSHVGEAVRERERRLERTKTRVLDAIRRDTLLIDTSGSCVGQVNGLSVVDLGEFRFGHPVRITATTRMGTGELVDIEREVELGGAIHSKGMLILSSALTSRYAPEIPLSLRGSVVFEQSYGGVEGDSASVAELCALLSSLSGIPINQSLAVTGSVNQLGRVQVVGGVNEKIEGFFDLCAARGLDGTHGVVVPRDNIKHLMLREDVVEAARDNKFSIYAVQDIDEAISVLTGVEAGKRANDGEFPKNTVNFKVEQQLVRLALLRKKFSERGTDDEGK